MFGLASLCHFNFFGMIFYLGALPKVVLRFKSVLLFYISTCNPSLMPESCLHLCDRFLKRVQNFISLAPNFGCICIFIPGKKMYWPKKFSTGQVLIWSSSVIHRLKDWYMHYTFLPNEEQNFQHQKDTFRSNKVHFNISSSHSGLICWSPRP